MSFFHYVKRFSGRIFFVFVLLVFLSTTASAQDSQDIQKSLTFIHSYQESSGGLKDKNPFDPTNTNPQDLQSAWGIIAYGSAGYDPATVKDPTTGTSLIDYLTSKACGYTETTDIERTILAIRSASLNPTTFGNCPTPLTTALEAQENSDGTIGPSNVSTIFGVLAYISYGHPVAQKTIDYIVDHQLANGGWEFSTGFGSDANTTAQAIMALRADTISPTDPTYAPEFTNAKNYLKSLQDVGGGIRYDTNPWTVGPDANSDAYTLQMIYSLGESPTDSFWINSGKTILDDLATLRQSNGSYYYSADVGESLPVFTTALIVPALNKKYLPIISSDLTAFSDFTDTTTPETPANPPTTTATTTPQVSTAEPETQPTNESVQPSTSQSSSTKTITVRSTEFVDQSNLGQDQPNQTDGVQPSTPTPDTNGSVLGVQTNDKTSVNWEKVATYGLLGLLAGFSIYYVASIKMRRP